MNKITIDWQIMPFSELSNYQLYDLLKARSDVFVVEQTCIYSDMDDIDTLDSTLHLVGYSDGKFVGTCRLLAPGVAYENYSAIGRVLISEAFRGQQLAAPMMQAAIDRTVTEWPSHQCKISAQQHLERFYQSLGFKTVTDMYLEDDIPHIGMLLAKS